MCTLCPVWSCKRGILVSESASVMCITNKKFEILHNLFWYAAFQKLCCFQKMQIFLLWLFNIKREESRSVFATVFKSLDRNLFKVQFKLANVTIGST